jgi:hypothetical protein
MLPAVYQRQRRFLAAMTIVAVGCAVAQSLTGMPELALYLTPVVLIAGMLLCGRYVGEERIVARWEASLAGARRRRPPRRLPRPAPARPLTSVVARRPALERGPPLRELTA